MSPKMGVRSGAQLKEARFSQSLETGMLIMRGFSSDRPIQGIADVADRMEASRSTVHRYMTTLVVLGMLEQDHVSRRYRVGMLPTDLGAAALEANRTVKALDGELRALRRKTGCTVRMGVLVGLDVLVVGHARSLSEGQGLLGVELRRGGRVPSHCTALGKVLLGAFDPKELRELLSDATLTKHTSSTVTGKRAVATEAGEAKEKGFAIEVEEQQDGVLGIAVPVVDSEGIQAAALSLVAHTPEVKMKDLEGHLAALRASASKIGARMEPAPLTRKPRL